MKWINLRRNFLLYSSLVVYAVIVVLLMLFLDRSVYQERKKSVIVDNFPSIIPDTAINRTGLIADAQRYFRESITGNKKSADENLEKLRKVFDELVHSQLPIYEIIVEDANGQVHLKVSNLDKLKKFNNSTNSLFLHQFNAMFTSSIWVDTVTSGDKYGRFIMRYTTPLNFPLIEELTTRYRYYALILFVSVSVIYFFLFYFIIRPMTRVVQSLERVEGQPVRLIPRPGTLLERYYNNLARSALLMEMQTQTQASQGGGGLQLYDFLRRIPEAAKTLFPFFRVSLLEINVARGGTQLRHAYETEPIFEATLNDAEQKGELLEKLEPLIEPGAKNEGTQVVGLPLNGADSPFLVKLASLTGREETRLAIAIQPRKNGSLEDRWLAETAQMVAEQIENSIRQAFTQQMLIFREKSETSVNLSRNLGHDLTNIIATGKLDLLTVKQFLMTPVEELEKSPQKRDIFKQSLDALLNNTKFMQEIVNIYRSFSYIKKPIYETCDMNELVQDTVTLFALATSRGIMFETELNPHAPLSTVERRLIKLALFNMLNNSAESIQRRTRSENIESLIKVRTLYDPDLDMVGLAVIDNGLGIRNKHGQIASETEIDHIFSLGFTTKQREEGEGLGLNWVYSIVVDFHRGKIVAKNRPAEDGGGAEFHLLVPVKPPATKTAEPEAQAAAKS